MIVTVVGGQTVKRAFDVNPGQDTVLTLKGLPLGNVTITEEAFETNCSAVTPGMDASWFSEPLAATLTPGSAQESTIILRPNGKLVITSQFVSPSGGPTGGEFQGPECSAQRTVHLVAGNGGLAWFTLLWPVPEVITAPSANYAFDDPVNVRPVPLVETSHPLFARNLSGRFLWDGIGKSRVQRVPQGRVVWKHWGNSKLNFDPLTGFPSASAAPLTSLTAAQLGILFSIARGNVTVVTQVSSSPFQGLVKAQLP